MVGASRSTDFGHDHYEMTTSSEDMLAGWTRDGEWLVSPVLDVPDGASRAGALVGLTSPGDMPGMEARVLLGGEPSGTWTPLGETWGEEDQHVATAELGDIGDGAQLRIRADAVEILQILQWTAVIPEPESADDAAPVADDLGVASEALRSELGGLGIVTRSAWGARATRCTGTDSRKTRMAVHHTVTGSADPARQMRGIQRFHMDTRGWCDVGYHFLIGQDGRVYEGRPLHLLGAHVGSNNTGNIGISYIGCFHSSGCSSLGPNRPSNASINIAGRLMGTLSRLYGITLDSTRVKGHGQHSGQSTSCPGDHVRSRIGEMISTGRTSTLSGGSTTPPPSGGTPTGGSCTHTYGGTYSSGACSASYQCCSGSWRERASGGCGTCTCTETTGRTGCTAAAGPPPGASCSHTYGGTYANTACSASYQCCNGSWRTRSSGGCGTCFCTETTGRTGCGT
ncbi:MAG: N-acetylmuramoyl-L-alanine amidase [Myxococcota bacterium]|nr:N-acetylmuramoyl-L-alanine amidase [Myxococcota bacterium]